MKHAILVRIVPTLVIACFFEKLRELLRAFFVIACHIACFSRYCMYYCVLFGDIACTYILVLVC